MAEIKGKFPNGLAAAMKEADVGSTALAEMIGDSKQNVTRWANQSRRLMPEMARKIGEKLGISASKLLLVPDEPSPPTVIRPRGPEPSTVEPAPDAPRLSQLGDFDVEVRGITVGGKEDEFYFNGEVIDHIRRPPGIQRAKNVFALNVSGDSMMPRFEPGEPIYVQKAHAVPGDYVVVELFPEEEGHAGKSFVKQLVSRTGSRIKCRQLNPKKEVEFDAGEVKDVYRVLKMRDLLG